MDAHESTGQYDDARDASSHGDDDGDALRALLDQFEAAERELRATEELRRVHAEQVARLRQEVTTSVDASLEACARERKDLEGRLLGLEEQERQLQGIKARMTGDPTAESMPSDDPNASSTTVVAPVRGGWVVSRPKESDASGDGDDQQSPEDRSDSDSGPDEVRDSTADGTPAKAEDSGDVPAEAETSDGDDAPAEGEASDGDDAGAERQTSDGEDSAAYEGGWYEVLKHRR